MTVAFTLFIAGMLTILLPCILPLVPIALGASISSKNRLQPLVTIAGLIVSFVGFNYVLIVLLAQFVSLADYIRISAFFILLLMGIGFLVHDRRLSLPLSVAGSLFFMDKGWIAVVCAAIVGALCMLFAGRTATVLQQLGTDAQRTAREELGATSLVTSFLVGLTMGLVWVPCAGPALAFALTLVREQPGPQALLLLTAYGIGASVPLLLIGYGGRYVLGSVRSFSRYTDTVKKVFGVILIMTALGLRFDLFLAIQTSLTDTPFGAIGTDLEQRLFPEPMGDAVRPPSNSSSSLPSDAMAAFSLPKISRAPALTGLGPWHNSTPLTAEDLKGKVVLIDFWTYSCINCIRTLPYIQGYWDTFKGQPFLLIGVHTPEFIFEKDQQNVAKALIKHGLTYPVAQDNDYGTWRAFANRYWPAKYLIDANGYIRYTHFGEGGYEETDQAIRSLLLEAGATVSAPITHEEEVQRSGSVSAETYLGSRSWPALGNRLGSPSDAPLTYTAPDSLRLHSYYLDGLWQLVDEEYQALRSDEGEIRMKFLGGEINLVLGLESGAASVEADVTIDGKALSSFTIDGHDLYPLFKGEYGEHELILHLKGKGAQAYAFTFGG